MIPKIHLKSLIAAVALLTATPALATTGDVEALEARVAALEEMMGMDGAHLSLEERVLALEIAMENLERAAASARVAHVQTATAQSSAPAQNTAPAANAPAVHDRVSVTTPARMTFFGGVDLDAVYLNQGPSTTTDFVISRAEFGVNYRFSDQLTGTGSVQYTEDGQDFEIDVVSLTYGLIDSPVTITAGQFYLPFGTSETALLNSPATAQLSQIRETAVAVNYENNGFLAGAYLFNGNQDPNGENLAVNYGARLGYQGEGFAVGVDYLSNLADADNLQHSNYGYSIGADVVAGYAVHGRVDIGQVTLAGQYVAATGPLAVDGNGSTPTATNLEASYQLANGSSIAASYQMTEEALFLGMPERRIALAYRTVLPGGLHLGFELAQEDDYAIIDGGSGETTERLTVRVTVPLE